MTLDVILTSRFKKDYKLMRRRGAPMAELDKVIDLLRQGIPLPEQYYAPLILTERKNE